MGIWKAFVMSFLPERSHESGFEEVSHMKKWYVSLDFGSMGHSRFKYSAHFSLLTKNLHQCGHLGH